MKVTVKMLEQMDFRSWWIKENCHTLIKDNPFLEPNSEDYEEYINFCVKTNRFGTEDEIR